MKYTGTIVKEPIVSDKKITTAIKLNNTSNPVQVITFPAYRDAETVNNMKAFKINDSVVLYGKEERNPQTKELQIIVNKAFPQSGTSNAKQSLKTSYEPNEVNHEIDFIQGGLSTGGKLITTSEPREGYRQSYTDGDWYWYKGDTKKTPTVF